MKNLVLLIVVSIFVLVGCQEESSILEPNLETSSSTLNRITRLSDLDIDTYKTNYSETHTIDGAVGGVIYVNHKWVNEINRTSRLSAVLEIPAGAFKGELTFDMIFDLDNLALELYPSPFTFDKPVKLDLVFKNVDLGDFDPETFTFNYLDGEFEDMVYESVDYDLDSGTLMVVGAELHHFSRYGWGRVK